MNKYILITVIVVLGILSFRPTAVGQEDVSTDSADNVRKIVQEKVTKAKQVALAEVGTITDISESTLQIENDIDEIKQVSVDEEETDFVNITKVTKTITFEDVAIGDFVMALGFKNGNGILSAKRIIVTTKPDKMLRDIVVGTIAEIDGKTVKLALEDDEVALEFGKSWKGPEIGDLEVGDLLIAVGEKEDDTIEVRTIEVVTTPETSEPEETTSPTPTASPEATPNTSPGASPETR